MSERKGSVGESPKTEVNWKCDKCNELIKAKNSIAMKSARYYHRRMKCNPTANKQPEKTEEPKPTQTIDPTILKLQEKANQIDMLSKKIDDFSMIVMGVYASIFNSNIQGARQALLKDYTFFNKLKDNFIDEHKEQLKELKEKREKEIEEKKRKYENYKFRLEKYEFEKNRLARELGYIEDEEEQIEDNIEITGIN